MKRLNDIVEELEKSSSSWPSLNFEEWPVGLRHDFSWHCTKHTLHIAQSFGQEPKQGSWYTLAAKRQWIAGKISTQTLQKSIEMAQVSMLPEEFETGGGWFQNERSDYETILHGIQEDLSPQDRAWIEADTSRYLAQDALSRLIWSTIQLAPPSLSNIVLMFQRAIRNLAATHAWTEQAHPSWEVTQARVRSQIRSTFQQENKWQREKLLHLITLHHEHREALYRCLQHRASMRKESQHQWKSNLEEALFS